MCIRDSAEAARPKVIDITNGGVAEPRLIEEDPMALLDRTMDELGKARFTFPSDKTMAEEMMTSFETTIHGAMEHARWTRANTAQAEPLEGTLNQRRPRKALVGNSAAEIPSPVTEDLAERSDGAMHGHSASSYAIQVL